MTKTPRSASPARRSPALTGPNALFAVGTLALLLGFGVAPLAFGIGDAPPPTLPDRKLTPGDVLPVTVKDICTPGYSKLVRDVPEAVKKQAYAEYGILHHKSHEYEVDHLISLELGGSNSLRNLWPESYLTQPWNAHVKDRLENRLHEEICTGKTPLAAAQQEIAVDWIAAYKKRFGQPTGGSAGAASGVPSRVGTPAAAHRPSLFQRLLHPRAKAAPAAAIPAPGTSATGASSSAASGNVWVNLNSGVFWQPGTRYYGKTKHGKYMSQADALKAGYHASKGE